MGGGRRGLLRTRRPGHGTGSALAIGRLCAGGGSVEGIRHTRTHHAGGPGGRLGRRGGAADVGCGWPTRDQDREGRYHDAHCVDRAARQRDGQCLPRGQGDARRWGRRDEGPGGARRDREAGYAPGHALQQRAGGCPDEVPVDAGRVRGRPQEARPHSAARHDRRRQPPGAGGGHGAARRSRSRP